MRIEDMAVALIVAGATGAIGSRILLPLRQIPLGRLIRRDNSFLFAEKKLERSLPDVLDRVASGMAAGFGLQQAMEAAAGSTDLPFSDVLSRVLGRVRSGSSLEEALEWVGGHFTGRSIPIALYTMASSQRRGTNLIESLTLIARTSREREALRKKVAAMTAQGRLQGIVLCVVPLLFLVGLFTVAPSTLIPVLKSPAGRSIIGLSLLLQIAGALVIRRMVRKEFL